ncbi:heavy-metal-associated domain-containing protein [Clostridium oryzae]|uniref:Copper chaperone CopZ n=1 Tax=Clostridium oryzae TaxID=1450648 RepID=A0A1V4IJ61_9CLOT|nr:heavy metal-associated domain-containing protein [Clostridium oryzae]OPJ60038.1 copper chaperone CopZ [Clostridium oryzae]
MKKEISIEGMSCAHCVKHVTEALESLAGVSKVQVSLESKSATIETDGKVSNTDIATAIEEAGYDIVNISDK